MIDHKQTNRIESPIYMLHFPEYLMLLSMQASCCGIMSSWVVIDVLNSQVEMTGVIVRHCMCICQCSSAEHMKPWLLCCSSLVFCYMFLMCFSSRHLASQRMLTMQIYPFCAIVSAAMAVLSLKKSAGLLDCV